MYTTLQKTRTRRLHNLIVGIAQTTPLGLVEGAGNRLEKYLDRLSEIFETPDHTETNLEGMIAVFDSLGFQQTHPKG